MKNVNIFIINKKFRFEKVKTKRIYILSIIFLILLISLNISYFVNFKRGKYPSRYQSLRKMKTYMKKCIDGEFINNNKISFNTSFEPKISVIIPLYNCEESIKSVVRSVQNQDMAEIEIFLVNDFSKDGTLKIVQELSEEDKRIKIINNQKNMGCFYSRNIGILQSKGKYIMNLDNDDLFMNKDVFDVVYEAAEEGNYDIIGFGAIEGPNYNPKISQIVDGYFHNFDDGLIVHQPELRYFPYTRNDRYHPNDFHVWGRLVKTNIYKEAINNLGISAIGEDRHLQFLSWNEDNAMSVVLFSFAQSYKFIKKYGIFHYMSLKTATNTRQTDEVIFSDIFVVDLMFDFSENDTRRKKYTVQRALEIGKSASLVLSFNRTGLILKAVFKKILNSQYVSENDKNLLNQFKIF